jgi:hypothetical protein
VTSSAVHPEEATHCHNCGAAVTYHYCSLCGQETKLHVPSASEFIHEFVGHYVALEGRLWKTMVYLLCKPGFLTAEYIAGRRVRYVEPLRVYLSMSILFFALLKIVGAPVGDFTLEPKEKKSVAAALAKERKAEALATAKEEQAEARADARERKSETNGQLRRVNGLTPAQIEKFDAFWQMPDKERAKVLTAGFFAYVPYAMFCLMPLFALFLKLLYLGSGRRYGEHLLFALHTNAFAFAMFALLIATSPLDWGVMTFAMLVWLVIYLPKAMRRVYGGSAPVTYLRWIVLSVLHIFSIAGAILTAFGLAVVS